MEAEQFRTEYQAALRNAADSLDLTEADRLLDRWWGLATLRVNPPSAAERDVIARVHAGEEVGWPSPQAWQEAQQAARP